MVQSGPHKSLQKSCLKAPQLAASAPLPKLSGLEGQAAAAESQAACSHGDIHPSNYETVNVHTAPDGSPSTMSSVALLPCIRCQRACKICSALSLDQSCCSRHQRHAVLWSSCFSAVRVQPAAAADNAVLCTQVGCSCGTTKRGGCTRMPRMIQASPSDASGSAPAGTQMNDKP